MDISTPYQNAIKRIKHVSRLGSSKIDLSGLYLSDLPEELWSIANQLTALDLSHNRISFIPSGIESFTNLEILILSHNNIKRLPSEIGKLQNLKKLIVENNQLTSLPPEIGKLINLVELNIRSNRLSFSVKDLEHQINLLHISNLYNTLKVLDLRNNELPVPPEILEKTNDPQSIQDYIDALEMITYLDKVREPRLLNEIKLLVVGQGSVGKSSLVQRITHNTFDPKQTIDF